MKRLRSHRTLLDLEVRPRAEWVTVRLAVRFGPAIPVRVSLPDTLLVSRVTVDEVPLESHQAILTLQGEHEILFYLGAPGRGRSADSSGLTFDSTTMTTTLGGTALELLGRVARILNSGLPPDDTLGSVAGAVQQGLGLEAVCIWRRDNGMSRCTGIASPPRALVAPSLEELPGAGPHSVRVPLVHAGLRLGLLELTRHPGGRTFCRRSWTYCRISWPRSSMR